MFKPKNFVLRRLLTFLGLVLLLTGCMYAAWLAGVLLLPEGVLRPYFTRLFAARVGEFNFTKILLANLFPFLGVQFMNLFRGRRWPGGLYVLPVFWILYGLILGTNSFVYAGQPVPLSISILWTRTGFMELFAYTLGYEATREWAIFQGFWQSRRIPGKNWQLQSQDWVYWGMGLFLLIIAVIREVQ